MSGPTWDQVEAAVSDARGLGLRLHQWHIGQGDPVYEVGSCLYAGIVPAGDDVLRASCHLYGDLRRIRARRKTSERALVRELRALCEALECLSALYPEETP